MTIPRYALETDGPIRRVPILDDTDRQADDYLWVDEPTNDVESARYWAAKHGEALSDIRMLQTDLSAARFQRDVYSVIGFVMGGLCGAALAAVVVLV